MRYFSALGLLTNDPGYEWDGRRPQAWRDELERLISGEWPWDEGQIATVEKGQIGMAMGSSSSSGQTPIYNVGKNVPSGRSGQREDPGIGISEGLNVAESLTRWVDIPESRTIAHVPGAPFVRRCYH